MSRILKSFALVAALSTAACASAGISSSREAGSGQTVKEARTKSQVAADLENGALLTRIAAPSIPKGRCGMVLWTAEGERPAPIFRFVSQEKATISVGGEEVVLERTQARGASGFGVSEEQIFVSEAEGLQVKVVAYFGLGFDGGSYLERGLITVETLDGWRSVTPAAGLAGCRV